MFIRIITYKNRLTVDCHHCKSVLKSILRVCLQLLQTPHQTEPSPPATRHYWIKHNTTATFTKHPTNQFILVMKNMFWHINIHPRCCSPANLFYKWADGQKSVLFCFVFFLIKDISAHIRLVGLFISAGYILTFRIRHCLQVFIITVFQDYCSFHFLILYFLFVNRL